MASEKRDGVEIEWFAEQVARKINLSMQKRVKIATEILKTQVVKNIGKPVERVGSRVIRSSPGEFPRLETARLQRDIFGDTKEVTAGVFEGYVGTTLKYGLILEKHMDRSFLVRTLNEIRPVLQKILGQPLA